MIKVEKINKSFGKQRVLVDIDLEMPEGSTTVIIGPSGEGKSVLLKHLIGLLRPDSGHIFIDGDDITKAGENELNRIRMKFGMLFQDAALFDSLNVFENVSFPLREHTDLDDDEVEKKVNEMLKLVNLEDSGEKSPSQLSGGMKKRVGLARALMLKPKILLFDEPSTGLDPVMTEQICTLIQDTHEHFKTTQVIISHNLKTTLKLADNIAMLHEGKIVFKSSPEEFLNSDNPVVKSFLKKAGEFS